VRSVWQLFLGVAVAVVVTWVVLLVVLWRHRPSKGIAAETLRIVPDVIRLTRRLAHDRSLPRGLRVRLWLLLAYLVFPIDLVPDFIPVIGYADDVVIVAVVLRSVVRGAGRAAIVKHWPGTETGLAAVDRLAGMKEHTTD
jgi:uncharacterized membrane protein YkvA (DUF1232 family)